MPPLSLLRPHARRSALGAGVSSAADWALLVPAMYRLRLGAAFIRQGTVHHSRRFRLAPIGICSPARLRAPLAGPP